MSKKITGTEFVSLRYHARELNDAAIVAYWLESKGHNVEHHLNDIFKQFNEIARGLGFPDAGVFKCEECGERKLATEFTEDDMQLKCNTCHDNWLSSQEGPNFEDSMAAKYDAKAREDAARALK